MNRVAIVSALIAFLLGLSAATFSELRVFLPAILKGAVVTVQVSVLSIALFLFMSVISGIGRASKNTAIRWISTIYVEVFRGTSLLVILFWMFFVMPEFGLTLSPMVAGVAAIGLNFGAYGAEVVRGAISAVPKGQTEATIALNMSPYRRMTRIVLPQAVAIMIPGMSNLVIELIKATALVSAVTLVDITYAAVQQNQLHYRTVEIFLLTMLLYYCLAQFVRFGGEALEERFTRHLSKRV
ncbi:Inner membrane amino-acid ABC transporter permease protein YecS [Falsiruegeria litorea R37]|uniref:Inner membrane amino-acid ABC transporter permease protein YecS n=1 Tax=Falsiruegeria litorea R37 TaxID=1200284 RepID=A0A1Y5TUL0_9RHOB|nr:ectoine/hydroxyectoine ABC transporter permease subunit EhuC [Falsiruegeria litorea]SLN73343.1 Inner membrane amino-acid ABC transporter permease protein YecS [Falsiruegeria litorea R37]